MPRLFWAALCVVVFVCVWSFPGRSNDAWDIAAINRTIEQTNFIVDRGCSGTLISASKGLILTNYHCIDGKVTTVERDAMNMDGTVAKKKFRKYEDVPVEQKHYDGFVFTGSSHYLTDIIAEAKTKDLAVLKLKGKTPHTFASPLLPESHKVLRGERVYTVGNPLGNDATLIEGIVSAHRSIDPSWTDGARLPMLQISGGIAGGNSGGALYNAKGFLIGVPAAGYSGANHLGFAIPMEVVRPFLKEHCLASLYDPKADDDACRKEKEEKAKKVTIPANNG